MTRIVQFLAHARQNVTGCLARCPFITFVQNNVGPLTGSSAIIWTHSIAIDWSPRRFPGRRQSFGRCFSVLEPHLSGPSKTDSLRQFDRHEADRFIGAPQCLPGTKDISHHSNSSLAALGNSSAPLRADRVGTCTPACPAILCDSRPGGHMARAQYPAQEEDDEGAAQSAYGRINKRHDGGVGRLRSAHAGPRSQNQRRPAQGGRGHHQVAVTWPEIPAVQEGRLQRWRVRQRERGEMFMRTDRAMD